MAQLTEQKTLAGGTVDQQTLAGDTVDQDPSGDAAYNKGPSITPLAEVNRFPIKCTRPHAYLV